MFWRDRNRRRIALATFGCLLFQQVAMAAYACTLTQMPAEPVVMAEDCAGMGMEQARDAPALCAKHCSPDQTVLADHVAPSVPALALPPPVFYLALNGSASHLAQVADVPVDRSDPPPRLRYCSLLI